MYAQISVLGVGSASIFSSLFRLACVLRWYTHVVLVMCSAALQYKVAGQAPQPTLSVERGSE